MKKLENIAVLPGDGIGPEVIQQAILTLDAIKEKYGHKWEYHFGLIGAAAIDETGSPFPVETLDLCTSVDAILLGAIGDPKYDNDPTLKIRPEQGLLAMRKALGLFANIRPIKVNNGLAHLSPVKEDRLQNVDFVIYRELTGGIYFGEKVKADTYSSDLCKYEISEIERISHLAFAEASRRKKHLTLVDKANVLETSRLWRKTVMELSAQYPEVHVDYLFIDNAAMQVILNPSQFDVLLCDNLFGDILSDEASVLVGSLGMLPSASIGEKTALYEPVHGSYPQAKGKDSANPFATILSAAMMLRDYGYTAEASDIESAIDFCLNYGIMTEDLGAIKSFSTSQLGEIISVLILEGKEGLKTRKLNEALSTIV